MPLTAAEVLSREFLEIRAKVLDLAAALDRLSRAGGSADDDPRLVRVREALAIVLEQRGSAADRAEQVQLVFSRSYDQAWQSSYNMTPR